MSGAFSGGSRAWTVVGVGLVTLLVAAGCGGGGGGGTTASGAADSSPALSTAPDSARVDLGRPMFSDPTTITHPLFPIDSLTQVVQVGSDADGPLRQEITLLPQTRLIEWDGGPIETISSQFIAYSGGRILEVAVDYFAQADDGSVWYFGEDVATYVDGVVDNHDGTWLAGRDGPPGMIMPADPQIGDVFRPENIPGLVFEEVVVITVDETVAGPRGPITGCLLTEEHPMDGAVEDKTFAPGYGEFHAVVTSENEEVTVSTGVPRDAAPGAPPVAVTTISSSAAELVGRVADWPAAESLVAAIAAAWQDYRSADLPPLSVAMMDRTLTDLQEAVAAQDEDGAQRAAFDVAVTATDLRMRHQDSERADLDRMGIVARRLQVEAVANDPGGSAGDLAVLQSIWARVKHTVTEAAAIDRVLDELRAALDQNDLAAASRTADALRMALGRL